MYFYVQNKKTRAIEERTEKLAKQFIEVVERDDKLKRYVRSFGIVGPCARGEGFYFDDKIRSDIDFFVLTCFINPAFERRLLNKFESVFGRNSDYSCLVGSPNSLKRPELFFFEFTNSGLVLYGEKLKPVSIARVSRFEGFRNIVYRGCFFLGLFDVVDGRLVLKKDIGKEEFLYYYSKVIFAIGEIFLLLDRTYVANNFERERQVKNSRFGQIIDGFALEHEKMHKFRYECEIPKDFDYEVYVNRAFLCIEKTYEILFDELFGGDLRKFRKVHPNFLTMITNRIFFTWRYFKLYKKIRFELLTEGFVRLNLLNYELIKKVNSGRSVSEKEIVEILQLWRCAGWFYYFL